MPPIASPTTPRLSVYLDHDVHRYWARALTLHGFPAHTTAEFGNERLSDEEQLACAAGRGLTLVSYNLRDVPSLHRRWSARSHPHAGIILAAPCEPRVNLRRLLTRLSLASPRDLKDHLYDLGAWLDT